MYRLRAINTIEKEKRLFEKQLQKLRSSSACARSHVELAPRGLADGSDLERAIGAATKILIENQARTLAVANSRLHTLIKMPKINENRFGKQFQCGFGDLGQTIEMRRNRTIRNSRNAQDVPLQKYTRHVTASSRIPSLPSLTLVRGRGDGGQTRLSTRSKNIFPSQLSDCI